MLELNKIGEMKKKEGRYLLSIRKEFWRALKYVDLFSHVILFFTAKGEEKEGTPGSSNRKEMVLYEKVLYIEETQLKKGKMTLKELPEDNWEDERTEYQVFDIKPYFPCGDRVRESRGIDFGKGIFEEGKEAVKNWFPVLEEREEGYQINPMGKIRKMGKECWIVLDRKEGEKEWLSELSGYSHLKVLWWFDRFDKKTYRSCVECNPPYEDAPRTGIFASRSPVRPNPVAMTTVKMEEIQAERGRIRVLGLECFDKTPCIGILPYVEKRDLAYGVKVPEWLSHWPEWLYEEKETKGEIKKTRQEKETVPEDKKEPQKNKSCGEGIYGQKTSGEDFWEEKLETEKPGGILVKGAREHNLKGINCMIPYGKITAVVGVSGSGKSSLVHDTIYAECVRRMDCLSDFSKEQPQPKADSLRGIIPAISVSQKAIGINSRSTVGSYSDAYALLRGIYSAVGTRYCPVCQKEVKSQKTNICPECGKFLTSLTPALFRYDDPESRCPVCHGVGQEIQVDEDSLVETKTISILDGASSCWGKLRNFQKNPNANWMKGEVLALADKMGVDLELPWEQLPEEFRQKAIYGTGEEIVSFSYHNRKNGRKGEIVRPVEGIFNAITRLYEDRGFVSGGKYLKEGICRECKGERLNMEGRLVRIGDMRYPEVAAMTFRELPAWLKQLPALLGSDNFQKIAGKAKTLYQMAQFAERLGIAYLGLSRTTATLSGGESQRLKLLSGLGNRLTGILYVLDEPSSGLSPKDYRRMAEVIQELKNAGNTVLMVEHNEEMLQIADHVLEIGPAAGEQGGYLMGEGKLSSLLMQEGTQISRYMGKKAAPVFYKKRDLSQAGWYTTKKASQNNIKEIEVSFPVGAITCVTGVSGSGKSSLVKGILYGQVKKETEGTGSVFSEVILVDQSAVGTTMRSVPATYLGVMDLLCELFAQIPEAVEKGMNASWFRFNGKSGACPSCQGNGQIKPKFSGEIWIPCPVCRGKRYTKEVLSVHYRGKSMSDFLEMSFEELGVFLEERTEGTENAFLPGISGVSAGKLAKAVQVMEEVGLSYLKLGQGTAALSGGEASRMKLAQKRLEGEKSNRGNRDGKMTHGGKKLFLFDEPANGLHFSDIQRLGRMFERLVEEGNTIVMIEHNRYMIKNCDYRIELGPGAGEAGGRVMYCGRIEDWKEEE